MDVGKEYVVDALSYLVLGKSDPLVLFFQESI